MLKEKRSRAILIRMACVTIIFFILLTVLGKVFVPYHKQDTDQQRTFYKTEKNSVDVLVVGSSTLLVGISPLELWKNHKISAYTRGSSVQAPEVTYLNVKESYKYQQPKVLVMGITSLFGEYDYDAREPFLRRGIDFKKFSMAKLETISEVVKKSETQHVLDYVFPILRYHDRWKELDETDIKHMKYSYDYMRGQFPVYKSVAIEPRMIVDKSVPAEEVNKEAWECYKKTIDYCKSQGTKVIVVSMPDERWSYGRYLSAKELLDENDVEYIDYNLEEQLKTLNLDWEKDFYDTHHLNPVGAQKTTAYLGTFLEEHYGELLHKDMKENIVKELDQNVKLYEEDLHKFKTKVYGM